MYFYFVIIWVFEEGFEILVFKLFLDIKFIGMLGGMVFKFLFNIYKDGE